MKLEIKKIGNSSGILLPKELMAELDLKQGDWLTVAPTADGNLMVMRHDEAFERSMRIVDDLMDEYRSTYKALAK